jgi:signal transduction histidine kinase
MHAPRELKPSTKKQPIFPALHLVLNYFRFGWPIVALVGLIACVGYAVLLKMADDQNQAFATSSKRFVAQSIEKFVDDNATITSDYALWTDAYQNITRREDRAWMDGNYKSQNVAGLAVYRPGVGIRYFFTSETQQPLTKAFKQIEPFLDLAAHDAYVKAPMPENVQTNPKKLIIIDGKIYAISMQPLRPEAEYEGRKPQVGDAVDYTINFNVLDNSIVEAIGASFDLSNLALMPGNQPQEAQSKRPQSKRSLFQQPTSDKLSYAIKAEDGTLLGTITWDNPRPGTRSLNNKILPLSLSLLLFALLTMVVMQQSVSARLRLFKQARDAAEAASHVKSNFLASVSHELRTPLNGIIGYAEMIQEDAEDQGNEVTAKDAKKLTNSARHLLSVINDLLDHSKIEAGKMDLNPTKSDIKLALENVVDNLQHQAGRNRNKLTLECDKDLGMAMVDAMRLKQCLFNLVSNAVKFTKDGTILVAARPVILDGIDFYRISVKDSGLGMSEVTLAKIFAPFTQADSGTSEKFGGTGLGLVITKALIEAMGGQIAVSSTLGSGSTFTLTLPRGLAVEATQANAPQTSQAQAA